MRHLWTMAGGGDWSDPDETCDPVKAYCYTALTERDREVIDNAIEDVKAAFATKDAGDACRMMLDWLRVAMSSGWIYRGADNGPSSDGRAHNGATRPSDDGGTWFIHVDPRVLDGAAASENDPDTWVSGYAPSDWSRRLLGTLLHEAAHTTVDPMTGKTYRHGESEVPGSYVSFPFMYASGGMADGREAEQCAR